MPDLIFATRFPGQAHSVEKLPGVDLFVWEKGPKDRSYSRGNVILVHGSSQASQPSFDLIVDGNPHLSLMERLAAEGWTVWCFDCEGYGKSSKHRPRQHGISDGADDLEVVTRFVLNRTGDQRVSVYGGSAGALRAALFAARNPGVLSCLAMDAFVWTGDGSPTLAERRKRLPQFQETLRRPISRESLTSIFERDHIGATDGATVAAFIEAVLALDTSIPNGTYIDMCTSLPVVLPEQLDLPVLIMRGEWDGIATFDDVLGFFAKLPNPDKQFAMMPGVAHAAFNGKNHEMAFHTLLSFLGRPDPIYFG